VGINTRPSRTELELNQALDAPATLAELTPDGRLIFRRGIGRKNHEVIRCGQARRATILVNAAVSVVGHSMGCIKVEIEPASVGAREPANVPACLTD
jgi:hypothetical protein